MYKKILLPACLLLIAMCASAQNDEATIRQVMAQQVVDWNNGDPAAFMQGYWHNDSVIFMTKTGPAYGWESMLAHYKKGYPDKTAMGTLQFSNLILKRLSDEYYFVIAAWHIHKATGPDVGGQFTLLFRKIGGEWKIIVDHTS
jgi:ketosteroid isomerase-like protein